jgi:hypothetical protein
VAGLALDKSANSRTASGHPCSSTSYLFSHGANVSINSGSTQTQPQGVVITPLPSGVVIGKLLVKTVNKDGKKKDPKTFTLRIH